MLRYYLLLSEKKKCISAGNQLAYHTDTKHTDTKLLDLAHHDTLSTSSEHCLKPVPYYYITRYEKRLVLPLFNFSKGGPSVYTDKRVNVKHVELDTRRFYFFFTSDLYAVYVSHVHFMCGVHVRCT